RVSGRVGRENSALIGAVIYLASASLIPIAYHTHSIALLLILSAIAGIAIGFYWPAVQALMGTAAPREKLLTFITIYNLAWSAGRMLGMRLSGNLFMHSPNMPFIVGGAISLLVVLATLAARAFEAQRDSEAVDFSRVLARYSSAEFNSLVVASAQLGNLLRTLSVGTAVALFPKWASSLRFSPAQVSELVFLLLVGHFLSFIVAPALYAWISPKMLVIIKIAISCGSILISLSNAAWQFFLSFLLVGVCAGLACTTSTYYSILSQGRTTSGSARHEASVGAGSVLGPILGGFIAQVTASQRSPYMLMAFIGLCLLALDIVYLLRRRN
ncbi:MAG: MFS transporter, partial [Armatimonadota bacterium]|nr:MFS transporter [Armatimonadota bacterium]MDW8025651.1 MFS transporter [Armatimonadota bacterium]